MTSTAPPNGPSPPRSTHTPLSQAVLVPGPQNGHHPNHQPYPHHPSQGGYPHQHPSHPQHYNQPPHASSAGPSQVGYSAYGRGPPGGGPPSAGYGLNPQPPAGAYQNYSQYQQHLPPAAYPSPAAIRGYNSAQANGAGPGGPPRLNGLLHGSPTGSQPLNLPPILAPPSPHHQTQQLAVKSEPGHESNWPGAGPSPGLPAYSNGATQATRPANGLPPLGMLDPQLAPPPGSNQPDLEVPQLNGNGPAAPRLVDGGGATSKKRPFDDLLGATNSAVQQQERRNNPAEVAHDGASEAGKQNGDMLAYIVKKAVQMVSRARQTSHPHPLLTLCMLLACRRRTRPSSTRRPTRERTRTTTARGTGRREGAAGEGEVEAGR